MWIFKEFNFRCIAISSVSYDADGREILVLFFLFFRDFYFFHRSLYPQLTLVKLNPKEANLRMRQMAFTHKLIEMGKILLTHSALAHTPENVVNGYLSFHSFLFYKI